VIVAPGATWRVPTGMNPRRVYRTRAG